MGRIISSYIDYYIDKYEYSKNIASLSSINQLMI